MEKKCVNVGPYIFKVYPYGCLYILEIFSWDNTMKLFEIPFNAKFLLDLKEVCNDLLHWGISGAASFPMSSSFGESYTLYLGDNSFGPSDDDFFQVELVIAEDRTNAEVIKAMIGIDQVFNIGLLIESLQGA